MNKTFKIKSNRTQKASNTVEIIKYKIRPVTIQASRGNIKKIYVTKATHDSSNVKITDIIWFDLVLVNSKLVVISQKIRY